MNASTILSRLASFLGFSSDVEFGDFLSQVIARLLQIDARQDLADRLGPDAGGETVFAVGFLGFEILILGQRLVAAEAE